MTSLALAVLSTLLVGGRLPAQTACLKIASRSVVRAYSGRRTAPPPQVRFSWRAILKFYRWKTLHEDLPGYTIINRGIDSFTTEDLVFFAGRLVLPYKPRLIVLHVGGNDVNNGKTPEQVLSTFQAFVREVRAALPAVPIAFSSLAPGPDAEGQAALRKETNLLIKNYVATEPGLTFIDLWTESFTPDGQPREDL